jgi:hypothetical protein
MNTSSAWMETSRRRIRVKENGSTINDGRR